MPKLIHLVILLQALAAPAAACGIGPFHCRGPGDPVPVTPPVPVVGPFKPVGPFDYLSDIPDLGNTILLEGDAGMVTFLKDGQDYLEPEARDLLDQLEPGVAYSIDASALGGALPDGATGAPYFFVQEQAR